MVTRPIFTSECCIQWPFLLHFYWRFRCILLYR